MHNKDYDAFGNVTDRTVETYFMDENETAEAVSPAVAGKLYDYKEITSRYGNDLLAQRKGNADTTITKTWKDSTKADLIDIQRVENISFKDGFSQYQKVYTYHSLDMTEADEIRTTYNDNIDERGNAYLQYITTERIDPNSRSAELEVISYKIIENLEFDSRGNVLEQKVLDFADEPGRNDDGTPIVEAFDGILVSAKHIINEVETTRGNILKSTVTEYVETDSDTTGITLDTLEQYQKLEIQVSTSTGFDHFGVAADTYVERYDCYDADENDNLLSIDHIKVIDSDRENTIHSVTKTYVPQSSAEAAQRTSLNFGSNSASGLVLMPVPRSGRRWNRGCSPPSRRRPFRFPSFRPASHWRGTRREWPLGPLASGWGTNAGGCGGDGGLCGRVRGIGRARRRPCSPAR